MAARARLLLAGAVVTGWLAGCATACGDPLASPGPDGQCEYDCDSLAHHFFPVSAASEPPRCFLFEAGNESWPSEMLALRTALDANCTDGLWEEQFWSQRQRHKLQFESGFNAAGDWTPAAYNCTTRSISIPTSENWIVQGGILTDGSLAPLDARFTSGNLSFASNAGVVLRYLMISGKSDEHSGGAFDYRGGDGAIIVLDHVHFLSNAATFGGAVNIGLANGESSSYDPPTVDGGLYVRISDCLFHDNTAFKYGALNVGDVWPLTLDLRDTVFVHNGVDFISGNFQVGYMAPLGFLPMQHTWTGEQVARFSSDHRNGRSHVRVLGCVIQDNSYTHLEFYNLYGNPYGYYAAYSCYCGQDCFVYNAEHCPSNSGFFAAFIYSAVDILAPSADFQFQITVEYSNLTLANMSGSYTAGIGTQWHSGNLSLSFAGGDTFNTNLYGYGTSPQSIPFTSALGVLCDPVAPCSVEISKSRWANNGYLTHIPTLPNAYAIAHGASLNHEDSWERIKDSVFSGHSAPGKFGQGAAVSLQGPVAFEFRRCLFTDNHAGSAGGAIYAVSTGLELSIFESVFVSNSLIPADDILFPVQVNLYSSSKGLRPIENGILGYPVWRIDDLDGNIEVDVRGNMSDPYHSEKYYSEFVYLRLGWHNLYFGLIPEISLASTNWAHGYIELPPRAKQVLQFEDDRALQYNCTNSIMYENGHQVGTPCPTGNASHVLWGNTTFFVGGSGGAAVATGGGASIFIADSVFSSNSAPADGSSLYSESPAALSIINTTFEDAASSIPVALPGAPPYNCMEHSCELGQHCTFSDFSVFCESCALNEIGDGFHCHQCPDGKEPNSDHTNCLPCEPGSFSAVGVCNACAEGAISTEAEATSCTPCDEGEISVNSRACACRPGNYDRSQLGIVTCVDNDWADDLFDSDDTYTLARAQVFEGHNCLACPPCLICDNIGEIRLKEGFQSLHESLNVQASVATPIADVSTSFLRCRPETAHVDAYNLTDYGVAAPACLGGHINEEGEVSTQCDHFHTGILCFSCASGYGKSGSDCISCSDYSTLANLTVFACVVLGVAVGVFIAKHLSNSNEAAPAISSGATAAGNTSFVNPAAQSTGDLLAAAGSEDHSGSGERLLSWWTAIALQPLKLFLSYWQIVANIGAVLHFQFPPIFDELLAYFRPLVINLKQIINTDCAGLSSFYALWFVEVFVVPVVLFALLYAFQRRKLGASSVKFSALYGEVFLLLFLIYPFVTNRLFSVLNCRQLSGSVSVLVDDYTVDCSTATHIMVQACSVVVIVIFSFGAPCALLVHLRLTQLASASEFDTPAWSAVQHKAMLQLQHEIREDILKSIIDLSNGTRYGNLTAPYKPQYFWWEPIDLLRKMLLVGLLSVVDRGSVAQVWVGIICSFCFALLHVKTLPFRHWEDNLLKMMIEAHIFVVLLLVLTLKTDLHGETLTAEYYDRITSALLLVMVFLFTILCIAIKWARLKRNASSTVANSDSDFDTVISTQDEASKLQNAFKRYMQAQDSSADRSLLLQYFENTADQLSTDFHVFISYRVRSEQEVAVALFEALSAVTIAGTRDNVRVYLDQRRLKDGSRWDVGFMEGLGSTWVVVPILSTEALAPMTQLEPNGDPDNVLLEMIAALELHSRGEIKAILPVVLPSQNGKEFDFNFPLHLAGEEHMPTVSAARRHLYTHPSSGAMSSEEDPKILEGAASTVASVESHQDLNDHGGVTASGVIKAILRFQGVVVADRASVAGATERIVQSVAEIVNAMH